MKTAIAIYFTLLFVLICTSSFASLPPSAIQLDFTYGSEGYGGVNWGWYSYDGFMQQLGDFNSNYLSKSPTDKVTFGTPNLMIVRASYWAMSSNGMGGVDMNYQLTYSDDTTDMHTLSIAGIGGMGNVWIPVSEGFITPKPLKSVEIASFCGLGPGFGPTWVCLDAVRITTEIYKPGYLISSRAAHAPIMQTASANYRFKVYGKVTIVNGNSFDVDDGSGPAIRVNAAGYSGISIGDYASAVGTLDVRTEPITITSSAEEVKKVN